VGPARGFPLRTRLQDTQTHAARVLVAGDAAGLVSPFTGEGIAAALNSGELAAEHALRALRAGDFSAQALAAYSRDLRAKYQADQRAARALRLILSYPRLLNRAFRRMSQNHNLAQIFSTIFLDQKSPLVALRPGNLLRMLIR
jgi:flavin-dependent dehydrogenase